MIGRVIFIFSRQLWSKTTNNYTMDKIKEYQNDYSIKSKEYIHHDYFI